jgi:hypothetical protein
MRPPRVALHCPDRRRRLHASLEHRALSPSRPRRRPGQITMRNQPPPDDPDIQRLLSSPAEVGRKRVRVGEICVRRCRDRQHRREPAWQVTLRLRQLLETGRYRVSPPGWVPSDMPSWDGYIELKRDEELVGLTRDRDTPQMFTAVTWYQRECLGWDGRPRHRRRPSGGHPNRAHQALPQSVHRTHRRGLRPRGSMRRTPGRDPLRTRAPGGADVV